MRRSRRYWYIGIGIAIAILALLGAMAARLQWASSVPARPRSLPATAIATWVPVPPTPLEFSPDGYWLACWLDTARNVDRCELTDYKGREVTYFKGEPGFEAQDYSSAAGPNPVPEARLHLLPVRSTFDLFVAVGQKTVPIARLQDGSVLVPTQYLSQLREHLVGDTIGEPKH